MLDFDNLKYAHKPECKSKNNKNIIHKNIYFDEICEVEYDAHCNECGDFFIISVMNTMKFNLPMNDKKGI